MEFLYPAFFAALAAISIPIIIHLFNLRKFKKVKFTNVHLLKAIEFETKAQSKLKHLLILLCRVMAVFFLVAAFSLPFIPNPDSDNNKVNDQTLISVYIDNSFSMAAKNNESILLDIAKDKARAIVNSYGPADRFQLLTNDFSANQQYFMDGDQFIQSLDNIDLSPNFRAITAVANRQNDMLISNDDANRIAYIITDLQTSTLDFSVFPQDSSVQYNIVPTPPSSYNNLYIDSCWFETPIRQYNAMEILNVRIKNDGPEAYSDIPVKLYINDQQKTPGVIDIKEKSSTTIQLNYVNSEFGLQKGKVIIRDYPVTFDDEFFFSYRVDSLLNVLTINGNKSNKALKTLFSGSGFNLSEQFEQNVDFGSFSGQNVIILNELNSPSSGLIQELSRFLDNQGAVVIFPSHDINPSQYDELLAAFEFPNLAKLDTNTTNVESINTDSEIFQRVFDQPPANINLPVVQEHFPFVSKGFSGLEDLMVLKNGQAFLSHRPHKNGDVYFFTNSLESSHSNFAKHSIFVPTLFNIALNSQQRSSIFYTIGENTSISISSKSEGELIYHLRNEELDIIPELQILSNEIKLHFHNQINQDGNYELVSESNEDKNVVAFNYNRKESSLDGIDAESLAAELNALGLTNVNVLATENVDHLASIVSFADQGRPLWKYCIILALSFLCIEMLLIKLWK